MSSITLTLELACTREEAARFAAVELFLAEVAENAEAQPPAELEAVFGARPRETILGLAGHPQPLGFTCRYDRDKGVMTLAVIDGKPNLAALPVLLLWLYPEKLPIAYSVHVTERPELAVWTIVGLNRIEITQHEGEVAARLEALRAASDTPRRLDLLPLRPLPRAGD
ncbi:MULTISPECIES: hypothetical protein [Novosphingobium]|jgi:hypothetical protein|uniref:Uncharacterized protein n=2 Tax=Novosphingobium TaxID=165696 RepID=A0A7Y0BTW7_9SPHN|nr:MULTISPECIES: hypothetical protein [Novosphingobium]KHS43740.1 hypothetical protein NJ75_03559 [Novosphingobium subterraneum]NML96205.1 hypothetical protein [Novosphingobium olei]